MAVDSRIDAGAFMLNGGDFPELLMTSQEVVIVVYREELKEKLYKSALNLSLEQQQRLCIARVIALKSDIILLDEPCSALDPMSTQRIDELLKKLSEEYTIVIVTHNMQQAARVSDFTGFMLLGELIEFDLTEKIFTSPSDKRTEAYITGHFG